MLLVGLRNAISRSASPTGTYESARAYIFFALFALIVPMLKIRLVVVYDVFCFIFICIKCNRCMYFMLVEILFSVF